MNNVLHIFAQNSWHDEATIIGDREALENLKGAIERALDKNEVVIIESFINDGEGYCINVKLATDPMNLPVPYTDGIAQETDEKIWKHLRQEISIK